MNRGLRHTDQPAHRLGVAPRFQIVLLGQNVARQGGGFIHALREADQQGHLSQRPRQTVTARQIEYRVHSADKESLDFAILQFSEESTQFFVVSLRLQGRLLNIERWAVVSQQVVEVVAQKLLL